MTDTPEPPASAAAPGTLYCIPTPIGSAGTATEVLAPAVVGIASRLGYFIAENARSARAFLKQLPLTRPLQAIEIVEHNEHTVGEDAGPLLDRIAAGEDGGLLSEAGCPGVADPGAAVVATAHRRGIRVVPLPGPSALLLALMASGLNGQRFSFAGYVPVDRAQRLERLRALERKSRDWDESVLMIETPYRNEALLSALLEALDGTTELTLAVDIGQPDASIVTRPVAVWKRQPPSLPKAPAVFVLHAPQAGRHRDQPGGQRDRPPLGDRAASQGGARRPEAPRDRGRRPPGTGRG